MVWRKMCGTDTHSAGRLSVKIHTEELASLAHQCHLSYPCHPGKGFYRGGNR